MPCNYDIKTNQICQVSDLLRHGAANAISCRELCQILPGWRPRDITRKIEAERRAGVPICANGNGYFLPADDAELDAYLRSLGHRLREVQRTQRAIAATRQQRMTFGGGGRT